MTASEPLPVAPALPATAPSIEQLAPGVQTRVPEGALRKVMLACFGAGILAFAISLVGMLGGAELRDQALFSYLVAYMFALAIALGSLFFVMLQHITRAGWSVVVRRIAENAMAILFPWMLLLFLPIALGFHHIYHHWVDAELTPGAPHYDPVLAGKAGYLNPTFFFIRVILYFVVWGGLATFFRRASLKQDQNGDPALSLRMSRVAAPGILLFGITITLGSIDWIMTLSPHWFSTIFGVCYFAGSVMSSLAFLGLVTMFLQRMGMLRDVINEEHYHDIGKLTFAFVVFWAYVNFSQFMLIWYANLPEETSFYQNREAWDPIFNVLAFGHFLIPFAFLMSRHTKRNPVTLGIAAVFLLAMHWVDMQYLIMPTLHENGFSPSWLDATTFIAVLGLFCGFVLRNIAATPLLPERDPRLAESLHFHNV